jgi:hypothetical protein
MNNVKGKGHSNKGTVNKAKDDVHEKMGCEENKNCEF